MAAHLERVGKNRPENLDHWQKLGIMFSDAEYGRGDIAAARHYAKELMRSLRRTSHMAN